jgi:hypothetical protein
MKWARITAMSVYHDLTWGAAHATRAIDQCHSGSCSRYHAGQSECRLIKMLGQYEPLLEKGALITIDETKDRVRILPFQ